MLLGALSELGEPFHYSKKALAELIVWRPMADGTPVPSNGILGEIPLAKDCHLSPAVIAALPLDAAQTFDLLTACLDKRMIAPGILIGCDLAYWVAAFKFTAGLVMNGQFLPGIVPGPRNARAAWRPIFTGTFASRMHSLARAMPPSARALTGEESDQPPAVPAEAVLVSFLSFLLDEMVRTSARQWRPRTAESLHDRWLVGLSSPDSRVPLADRETLSEQIRQWQRPIQVAARAPFRLCFRMEEPSQEEPDSWNIEYLLQSIKDPSLLVPATSAWQPKGNALAVLGPDTASIREHLLASLGQASQVCPAIQESLKQRAPGGYTTDTNGAHRFLMDTAPALEQSGFGVLLPSWWTRKRGKLGLKAHAQVRAPKMAVSAGLSLDMLVQFDWQLALGGEPVTAQELATLAKHKSSLVKLRGQWVEVNATEIQRALDFLKKHPTGEISGIDAVRLAIGADEHTAAPIEVESITATGWIGDVLDQLQGRAAFEELPPPPELHAELRPYQLRGFSWLQFLNRLGLGACLADDMGLGKTIQTLALIQHHRSLGTTKPVLLICPTSVVGNWQKESTRFTPELPVMIHHGSTRTRGGSFLEDAARHAIVVSSYSVLQRDIELIAKVEWAGVILDEAQNIKNPETKQARAARSLPAGYRIALTGTPVENNTGDLWSIMEFLNPGFLGAQASFRKRFFIPIHVYSDAEAASRLRRITSPFILRRLKTDKSVIADLPEKLEMKVFCNLTKEQASLYEATVKQMQRSIESAKGIERKGLVLATLTKLKQICNHPAQFLKDRSSIPNRSGKLARLTEMLEETLEVGDRSLIFTQFAEMGEILRSHLQESFGIEVLYLHGGTPKGQRDRMVERFAEPTGPSIFLLSLKAGGTGLNLTSANHVFHYDRWWNPAVENQATDRAFRIGQTRNVQVHKYVCAGTLEEKIDEMIEKKRQLASNIIGAGETWLGELSNSELRDLFALRQEAVGE